MKESSYYASKPPACSSPIVQMIDGKLHRVHDGHSYGRNVLVPPSKYPVDDSLLRPSHFDAETQE